MNKEMIKRIGITLIFLGIFGFLIINAKIIGYVISSGNDNQEILEFPQIGNLIIIEGDKKTISIDLRNNGNAQLNNCNIIPEGEINPWIYSNKDINIPSKEETNFEFQINIPEKTLPRNYSGALELKCDEISKTQNLTINIVKKLNTINIKNLNQNNEGLTIDYLFNNEGYIGDQISIEIWITDPEEKEITRTLDIFPINRKNPIERSALIKIPKSSIGVHNVNIGISSELENYLRRSILLGKSKTTGNAIFNLSKGKATGYITFLIIIGLGVLFIFLSHRKSVQEMNNKPGIMNPSNPS